MVETGAVVDTAPLVFYLSGAEKAFGREPRRLLRRAETGRIRLAVPTVCLFEVAQLEERGRIRLETSFDEWCDAIERDSALLLLPLERRHVVEARALPTLRDPFDRLIAGSAIALGVPLISPDPRIAASGRLRVVW